MIVFGIKLVKLRRGVVLLILIFFAPEMGYTQQISFKKYNNLSLDGNPLKIGVIKSKDGNIHKVPNPLLSIKRSRTKLIKGTILLIPGGDFTHIRFKNEGDKMSSFLNSEGFDVAVLTYSIIKGASERNKIVKEGLKAVQLLGGKAKLGLRGKDIYLMGFSSGAHLAARIVQQLPTSEQPAKLILISPINLNDTLPGSVFPLAMPPVTPITQLFVTMSSHDQPTLNGQCIEYIKTWKGYDGAATSVTFQDPYYNYDKDIDPTSGHSELINILKQFLHSPVQSQDIGYNSAAVAVAGKNIKRHQEKLVLVAAKKYDLIMIGNSITHNFEKPAYQAVWNQFFLPRNALNLGFSGYRTENLIWNIENGELEGQSPKVVVLEIGTNNVDEKNYPVRHTAAQLAGGITSIVKLLRLKLPETKIIILRCFPGCYGGPKPTSHRAILERASDIVSKLADEKNVFYCDVNHVFLNMDGSINHHQLQDWLHPSPDGAKSWAQAMEPLLSQLMGDQSLDTATIKNTATFPVPVLEKNSYNWWGRHKEVLEVKDKLDPEIILIGNSITHLWGGSHPRLTYADGSIRIPNGPQSWESVFSNHRVLNLGFGWDRTQNVLWRLDHGEIDGLHPKVVLIDIGTNNTSETAFARINTVDEIIEGIKAVCLRVRSKIPGTKIILMAIFPREKEPLNPRRKMISEINLELNKFAKENQITIVDIGDNMLSKVGYFLPGMMLDYTHPSEKGYQVWADGIRSLINEL